METYTLYPHHPAYPATLTAMHRPPSPLFYKGDLHKLLSRPRVAIVGSRRMTEYGQSITAKFARELAEQGIVIVSGLAFGVDAQAHKAALDAGGLTMAVLPNPIDQVAPTAHEWLANQIMQSGGALVSSYPANSPNHKGNFVARNEIVAGISDAVIITEAAQKSGSLHTASFAQNLGVPVYAVPGSIDMPTSAGTNMLIQSHGAQLITSSSDVLPQLGIVKPLKRSITGDTPDQQQLVNLLLSGPQEGSVLLAMSTLSVQAYNHALTMLEICGKIRPLGSNRWTLS